MNLIVYNKYNNAHRMLYGFPLLASWHNDSFMQRTPILKRDISIDFANHGRVRHEAIDVIVRNAGGNIVNIVLVDGFEKDSQALTPQFLLDRFKKIRTIYTLRDFIYALYRKVMHRDAIVARTYKMCFQKTDGTSYTNAEANSLMRKIENRLSRKGYIVR